MGIVRYLRGVPPAHYLLKIDTFSKLRNTGVEKFESAIFEASGYKWMLTLYPNGNKKGDGAGHISMYLGIAETDSLSSNWAVNVYFKMFVLDKKQNKYLTIEDDEHERKTWRFDKIKTEWGFDKLISQATFNDPSKGHLVNDACVFGVEVFVDKYTGVGESLSITKLDPRYNHYKWQIPDFSGKDDARLWSDEFTIGGYKWKAGMHPKGFAADKNKSITMALKFVDSAALPYGRKVYAEYEFTVKNKLSVNDVVKSDKQWFSVAGSDYWGIFGFMPLVTLNNVSKGFLIRDTLTVEVKIPVVSVSKDFA